MKEKITMTSSDRNTNNLEYAIDEDDAIKRHTRFKGEDPFPSIKPALLNSADIADYVSKTAIIHPFYPKNLKPASYEMHIGGEVIFWDEKNEMKHIPEFKEGMEITFKKNSITFVTVNATFRLPDYIAIRFNLQIEHVHRGLLLGTGPLVNPGFRGQLMIPIHNLTNNDYVIESGYPLIGVEFTKLSPNAAYSKLENDGFERQGTFIPNKGC